MTLPKPVMIKIAQAYGIQPRKRAHARGGGGGYWNETDGTAGVRWIGEKQKEVTDSHLACGRVNRASNNGMVLTSGDESGVTRVI